MNQSETQMWNDKIEATPKTRPTWLVPAFFVCLAVIGAGALVIQTYVR